jgi:hypothetical protein
MFCRILVSVDEDLVSLDIPRWAASAHGERRVGAGEALDSITQYLGMQLWLGGCHATPAH